MRRNCKPLLNVFRLVIIMVMAVLGSVQSFAQGSKISGTVVDENGEPVIGAAVVVTGSTNGTITDIDGKFVLAGVSAGTPLTISFLGYETANEPAANGMTVTLKDESQQVEEVQVVAYGVQKKITTTGAISSVKSEDLVRTPVSTVSNVLAGQLSGVSTVQYSGEPGSDAATIFVRGKASFADGGADPLVQIDGVERSMADVDPNEIESITVLKDASATAVFGVRGANGVILITTKRGKEGKANINVSTSFSALTPTKMVEMASSLEYAEFYNMMNRNDGAKEVFTESVIEHFRKGDDPIRFPNVDWADYIMKQFTLQTQSNLSISGGSDKVRYFISAGLFTQGGLFEQFDMNYDFDYRYKRYNYRSNIDIDITKYTTLSVNVAGKMARTNKPRTGQGSSGMIKNIYYATPFSSPGFVDGKFVVNSKDTDDNADGQILPFIGGHGMAYYFTSGYYQQDDNNISFDLLLNQKLDMLTKGLVFRAKGSYNSNYWDQKDCSGGSVATWTPLTDANSNLVGYRKIGDDRDVTSFKHNLGKGRNWYFEAAFDYNRTFADAHTVKALVLYNQSKQYYLSSYSDIPRTYVGLVGRVGYDYKNRYMAEFNFGHNGSENFSPENRYGSFPAGSVGWNISEEAFMENLKPALSFLKVRASWGLVGNDKIGGARFMYTADPYSLDDNVRDHGGSSYIFGAGTDSGNAGNGRVTAAKPSQRQLNNPNITWETAFKQDYGIDVNFVDDRLKCSFDYYYEKRRDILAKDDKAPNMLGFDQPYTNLGEVDSWGWEASLGWNDKINDDWRIWAKFNISYNQNEILKDGQAKMNNDFQYTKGHRIGARSQFQFWGLYEEGVSEAKYMSQFGKELPTQSKLQSGIMPGDAIFVDLDGNGVVDDNDATRDLGFTDDPEYIAGLNAGFQWKQLSFNVQFAGAWNVSRMISDVFRVPFQAAAGYTEGGLLKYHVDNTWTEANPNPDSKYPRASFVHHDQNYATCTLYEQDSKYLRLKTAEIAYDFKFNWMKSVGLKRFQVAVNGYNLLTWTPFIWGDPETRQSNAPSYPLQRTYTGSLRLNF